MIYKEFGDPDLHAENKFRHAVRAIICRENRYLMIYSPVNGDYKFPGGGIENGENPEEALKREILEETGFTVEGDFEYFGSLKENRCDFQMTSDYFICNVSGNQQNPNLDDYEEELGFSPRWVTLEQILVANYQVLKKEHSPLWTERDTWMVQHILQIQLHSFLPLLSERLEIRLLQDRDIPVLNKLFADPKVMEFSLSGPKQNLGERFYISQRERYLKRQPAQYAVQIRETGELAGFCGFFPYETQSQQPDSNQDSSVKSEKLQKTDAVEIAFRYLPGFWGQGIGLEAAALAEMVLKELKVQEYYAVVESKNIGSVKILERLGMNNQGTSLYKGIPVIEYHKIIKENKQIKEN